MDPTKTHIWHSQDLGVSAARSGSNAPGATGTDTGLPRRSSVPPPPPSSRARRPNPLAATRIMPIEQLFPNTRAERSAPPASVTAPRFRMLKRIGLHVLLGTLTLLAVAAWKLPRAPARARLMPLQTATVVEEPQGNPHVQNAAEPELAAQPTVAQPARATEKFKTQQERRAIELVIAGDYLGAEQAYRALASERPDTAVFREAARILAARQMPLRRGE